jgi:hypothetical protein
VALGVSENVRHALRLLQASLADLEATTDPVDLSDAAGRRADALLETIATLVEACRHWDSE